MTKKILIVSIFLFGTGIQATVQALALGEPQLKSCLNEPLHVLVPLVSAQEDELNQLKINIMATGPAGLSHYARVKAVLVNKENRPAYIQITGKDNLREPTFSFILELNWPKGRIQRSYSLLIDPRR